jgi:hypothetical protein
VEAAEREFRNRFPLEPPLEEDWLRSHLLSTALKWGKITQFATEGVHIRTVPRRYFFDAAPYSHCSAAVFLRRCSIDGLRSALDPKRTSHQSVFL